MRTRRLARQIINAAGMMQATFMAPTAVTKRFRTETTLTIWSMATCTIHMAITVIITGSLLSLANSFYLRAYFLLQHHSMWMQLA